MIARCFSASISAVARSRRRSSSAFVAAMSASRASWATFWARLMISFASRRASWMAARRSASALSRSWRACSASARPCSTRARRSLSIRVTGLPNSQYSRTAKKTKFSDETMTQNRLIWSPDGPLFLRQRVGAVGDAARDREQIHDQTSPRS